MLSYLTRIFARESRESQSAREQAPRRRKPLPVFRARATEPVKRTYYDPCSFFVNETPAKGRDDSNG